jgi:hypothetical protein
MVSEQWISPEYVSTNQLCLDGLVVSAQIYVQLIVVILKNNNHLTTHCDPQSCSCFSGQVGL